MVSMDSAVARTGKGRQQGGLRQSSKNDESCLRKLLTRMLAGMNIQLAVKLDLYPDG
jgi:hypothetical protein